MELEAVESGKPRFHKEKRSPSADGRVRNANCRDIMAGKWINSQRIDSFGNGHWDGDAEKTAFAVLLLNEM